MESYDLVIIGAGFAGINASLRATDLNLKVALIEKDLLGGTCLNRGCIPTKSFIQSAKLYLKAKNILKINLPHIDFKELKDKKNNLIERLRLSLSNTLKNRNITYINSFAKFKSEHEIEVNGSVIEAKNIIIAVGSRPQELNFLKFDKKRVLSSDEILELDKIPSSILIVGAGVIGCEFASLFNILGAEVTLVELLPHILPQEDNEISLRLLRIFKKRGIKVYTSFDLRNMDISNYQLILVSVGRIPNTETLGLEKIGIKQEKNWIVTDDYLKTNIPNIYAIGDCTNRLMLAHLASYQGWQVPENIVFPKEIKKIKNPYIPNCIFTYPEVARVGLTEEEAKKQNLKFEINRFDFLGLGMSHILEETEGLIKIIWDRETDSLLGASIIGPSATEIIGILNLAIQNKIKISELKNTIFAHPTISECISEVLKQC
jgi:dihydrolipoamide dehydrogenase